MSDDQGAPGTEGVAVEPVASVPAVEISVDVVMDDGVAGHTRG